MLKIILNIFYSPVKEILDIIEANFDLYVPINGGSKLRGSLPEYFLFDDTGDSISDKNYLLNEMTSIYWFWKNFDLTGIDYIGFNHYRRFFRASDINDYREYDIIVAKPIKCPFTLAWQYNYYHNIADLQICCDILKNVDSDFQSKFVDYLNTKTDNYAPCNMFVMRKDLFIEWCKFIFPVADKLINSLNLCGRDNYQRRAVCFLIERIFGFWCYDKMSSGLRVKEIEIDEHKEYKNNMLNERGTY